MGGNDGLAHVCDVLEPFQGDVAGVQHDPQRAAPRGQTLAIVGQARALIRITEVAKGHAVAKDVVARPDRPQRPQADTMQHIQRQQIGVDAICALQMQDTGQRIAHEGARQLVGLRDNLDLARIGQLQGDPRLPHRGLQGPPLIQRIVQGFKLDGRDLGVARMRGAAGRAVDGKEPAAHPARATGRRVHVACIGRKMRHGVALVLPQPHQRIVVPIKYHLFPHQSAVQPQSTIIAETQLSG